MKNLVFLIFICCAIACEQKKPSGTTSQEETINFQFEKTPALYNCLKAQLENGISVLVDGSFDAELYKYGKNDLEVTFPLVKEILQKKGYQFPAEQDFIARVQKIFGRTIDPKLPTSFLYVQIENPCEKQINYYRNDKSVDITPYSYYLSKKEHFITELYAIPELIDYQALYPDLYALEQKMPRLLKDKDGEERYEVYQWQQISNLKEQREKNIDKLVHRNKYLFNDDKASFQWLIANDAYFMSELVKKIGYTEDEKLLEWAIKNTHYEKDNPQDYGRLFWTKNCKTGGVKIHLNTFKILRNLYSTEAIAEISNSLKAYINYLGNDISADEESKKEQLTENEYIQILAHIAYFAQQYDLDNYRREDYHYEFIYFPMGRLRYFLNGNDRWLKEKQYFGLPKFKEWWDKAAYAEYYLSECEYEGSCGPGYQPLSEEEWKKQQK